MDLIFSSPSSGLARGLFYGAEPQVDVVRLQLLRAVRALRRRLVGDLRHPRGGHPGPDRAHHHHLPRARQHCQLGLLQLAHRARHQPHPGEFTIPAIFRFAAEFLVM